MSDDEEKNGEFPQSYEILEMIFMHLPGELEKLKEVCKRFYQVINSSMPLMKRVTFKWNHISVRCYRGQFQKLYNANIEVREQKYLSRVAEFMQTHSRTLSKVSLTVGSRVDPNIHQMLSLLSSVEKFALRFFTEFTLESPITMNKLQSLTLNSGALVTLAESGENCGIIAENLKIFIFVEVKDSVALEKMSSLMKFLRNQLKLEELHLNRLAAREFLRQSQAEPFAFQLKKITLRFYPTSYESTNVQMDYPYDDTYTTPFLPQFLAMQQDSLTHLAIEDVVLKEDEVLAILTTKLKNVELLSIDVQCYEDPGVINTTIKSLVIGDKFSDLGLRGSCLTSDLLYHFVDKCRGLESLEIKGGSMDLWWSMVLADLPRLTNLELNKCDFIPLPFQAIERLEIFTKSGSLDNWIPAFIRMNPTLKTVSVPRIFQEKAIFLHVTRNIAVEYNLKGFKYADDDDGFFFFNDSDKDDSDDS